MNSKIHPLFPSVQTLDGQMLIQNHTLPIEPTVNDWQRRALAAECALIEAQDAMRCAADLLQLNAPGRALEILEAQLR